MNLPALYVLLASPKCTNADGTCRLPSWEAIAREAEVDAVNDTYAIRALVEKGALLRIFLNNTYGDFDYRVVRPRPEQRDAFFVALRTVGAKCPA